MYGKIYTNYLKGGYLGTSYATSFYSYGINIYRPEYIIEYDANGGTGAPPAQVKTKGQTVTLSSIRPTRTGYTFIDFCKIWEIHFTKGTSVYNNLDN